MNRQLKVGLFVGIGIVLLMITVFSIGEEQHFWVSKTKYRTSFADVAGLKPGAPVRMGGIDIGSVVSVGHAPDARDPRIYVAISVVHSETARIKTSTVSRIVNKGLLGDKMIELTTVDPAAPPLPMSEMMKSEDPSDPFAAAGGLAEKAKQALDNVETATRSIADPRFTKDLQGTVAGLNALLNGIATGDGELHRLIFDPKQAERFDRILANAEGATARLDGAIDDVREITSQVKNGPGILHALVYDGEISKDAAGALSEVHQDLLAIRQGNGLAHAVLYGDGESQHLMTNLGAMSDDLRAVISGVRQGKGTIGALLVDPSLYEDLKGVVGNVERNEVLRALVRYTIKQDQKAGTGAAPAR